MATTGRETQFHWRNIAGRPAILVDKTLYNGDFIWVDSGDSRADNSVGSNVAPCSTYAGAEALATANQGDVIIIRPGHAESLTAAIALAKAGILTIGLAWGTLRPTFTSITNAVAALTITGGNRRFMGLRFICNIASQTESIDVAADDVIIDGNEFREGSATGLSFITADTLDGDSDRLQIINNTFYAPTVGNYNQAIEIAKDHDEITIEGNKIYGDFDEACIQIPADGKDCTNIRMVHNELSNLLSGQHAIQINSTTCTGRIAYNDCETDTQAATIDGGACSRFGNLWCDVDGSNDEEGIPVDSAIAGGVDDQTTSIGAINDTTTDSLHGKMGTDTEMGDVSFFDQINAQTPQIASKSTGDLTSFGATLALFTVTGDVWVRAGASMDVAVTSTSGTTTLGIGVAGNDACLCVQDTVDNTAFAVGDSWTLATAADANGAVMTGDYVLIGNGDNIILTGNVDDITAGDMDVYVQWFKASDDGNVVAA